MTWQERREAQSQMIEKVLSYTKVVLGLGYAGFFTAWSGAKPYLSPKELVSSGLCMTISVVAYLVFEVYQGFVMSRLSNALVWIQTEDDFQKYASRQLKTVKTFQSVSKFVYPVSALTGLTGVAILVYAFVHSLFRLWHP